MNENELRQAIADHYLQEIFMDSSLAGVNHGVLFSMEMVLVIKTLCNRILRRQAEFHNRNEVNLTVAGLCLTAAGLVINFI